MKLRNTKPEPVGIFVLNNTVAWGCKLNRARQHFQDEQDLGELADQQNCDNGSRC